MLENIRHMKKVLYDYLCKLQKKRKNFVFAVIILLFIIFSFRFISPFIPGEKSDYSSAQLNKVVHDTDGTRRIDYVDDEGKVTIASELGYSTILIDQTDHSELERYYDNNGNPVKRRYVGYYGVLRERDESGNIISIKYLNKTGDPMSIPEGYAEERRENNEHNQTISVNYYDVEGQPVYTESYGYGKRYEYDDAGRITKIIHINADDKPVNTGLGYAMLFRYYQDGDNMKNSEKELYFGENGDPVALSMGQFGTYKEYDKNGMEVVITYLDREGKPMNAKKGYATIIKTYHANGKTASERYYDKDGYPFALSEGQYGIRIVNDNQRVYVDQYGNDIINLKNLLYSYSWIVILCAILIVLIVAFFHRKYLFAFLALYILFILYLTLIFRDSISAKQMGLLWEYRRIFIDTEVRADIIKNIWLFIPLGSIVYCLYPKRYMLLIPFSLSLIIEIVQLSIGIGYCDIDDIISNSIGAGIGFYIEKWTIALIKHIKSRRDNHNALKGV